MTSAAMRIRPIRTEEDHDQALERIDALMSAALGSAEGEELDLLVTLVDAYEAKHHAIDAPTPIAAIEFRMEQQGLSRKDLEPMLGSRSRISEILAGKRNLSLNMIRRLKLGLGISADVLIEGAPKLNPRSATARKITTRAPKRGALHTNRA